MISVDLNLKQIIQRAQDIQCLALPCDSMSLRSLAPHFPTQPTANISFPDPPPIQPALMAAGAHSEISLAIDQAYQKRAADLRAHYHSAAMLVCSNQAQYSSRFRYVPEQKILSLFTELYHKQLVAWKEESVVSYLTHSSTGNKAHSLGTTPQFNHEYVPLLEHFFAENPFPTHANKAFLAKKSAMTYRQIHVWFQNRRNRIKKEGRVLRKKQATEGASLPLDTLYQRMEKFIEPEGRNVHATHPSPSHSSTNQEDQISSVVKCPHNPLEPLAPLHAFPSSYPPSCSYDPFPSRNGVAHFGAPQWFRRPINTPVQHPSLDVDGLIESFSQMNTSDDYGSRSRGNSFAAVAAITIIPFSAPLPALLRGSAMHMKPVCTPLFSVPAAASCQHVFNTPSIETRPVTLVPVLETPTGKKVRRRKLAPLPRRVPHGNPISHRDVTPAFSEASVASPSPSSPSRSSSFGSQSSSSSHTFSEASSTSSTFSSPVTPTSSPSPPSYLASRSTSFNFSSSMTSLFGDTLEDTPSPIEGLQLDPNPIISGKARILKSRALNFCFNATPVASLVRTAS